MTFLLIFYVTALCLISKTRFLMLMSTILTETERATIGKLRSIMSNSLKIIRRNRIKDRTFSKWMVESTMKYQTRPDAQGPLVPVRKNLVGVLYLVCDKLVELSFHPWTPSAFWNITLRSYCSRVFYNRLLPPHYFVLRQSISCWSFLWSIFIASCGPSLKFLKSFNFKPKYER